uniref:Adenylosuccinate synthase n=1 Tax=Leersia perrieri TaxID=77586 RepID=A0A0D9X6Q9_9ORYZ
LRLGLGPRTISESNYEPAASLSVLPAAAGARPPAPCAVRVVAASVATAAAEESASAQGRLESLSQVAGVLGTQWGDEGKGKLVFVGTEGVRLIDSSTVDFSENS